MHHFAKSNNGYCDWLNTAATGATRASHYSANSWNSSKRNPHTGLSAQVQISTLHNIADVGKCKLDSGAFASVLLFHQPGSSRMVIQENTYPLSVVVFSEGSVYPVDDVQPAVGPACSPSTHWQTSKNSHISIKVYQPGSAPTQAAKCSFQSSCQYFVSFATELAVVVLLLLLDRVRRSTGSAIQHSCHLASSMSKCQKL